MLSISSKSQEVSLLQSKKRWQVEYLINPEQLQAIASSDGSDVVEGLSRAPKCIPMHYRYDDQGSQLFEQVCDVPEYYLTRTETAILHQCANGIAQFTGPCELVELGSGSAVKTRILLDAYQQLGASMCYKPVDISAGILESSALSLVNDYPSLQIQAFVSTFEMALERLPLSSAPTRMISFIGNTLGNFNPQASDALLTEIAAALQSGEYFLLGLDLHKSTDLLEAAYNDSQGANAQFNFNILHYLNQQFQGDFDIAQFNHYVVYNQTLRQIEVYLQSLKQQMVKLNSLNLNIELSQNETILTAISRKFELSAMHSKLFDLGLQSLQTWTDPNQWYALILARRL
jgi:L-histidine Nalpha-methyltransferase